LAHQSDKEYKMKKTIEMTEEEIVIMLELLEKVQSRGQALLRHPGELRTIWEIEGKLEKASTLVFDERYKETLEGFLNSKWDAKLVKLDLEAIKTTQALFETLAKEFDFPDYFGHNWDAFDECLADFCSTNIVIMVINIQSADPEMVEALELLKKCAMEFSATSKFKIEVLE
jgi:RNAse (barnase) inhibitor barstar